MTSNFFIFKLDPALNIKIFGMEQELGQFLLSSKIMTEQRISQTSWCRGTEKTCGVLTSESLGSSRGQFEKSHLVSSTKEQNKHTRYSLLLGSSQHSGIANFCIFVLNLPKFPPLN